MCVRIDHVFSCGHREYASLQACPLYGRPSHATLPQDENRARVCQACMDKYRRISIGGEEVRGAETRLKERGKEKKTTRPPSTKKYKPSSSVSDKRALGDIIRAKMEAETAWRREEEDRQRDLEAIAASQKCKGKQIS